MNRCRTDQRTRARLAAARDPGRCALLRAALVPILALALGLASGCREQEPDDDGTEPSAGISLESVRGPLTVRVITDRSSMTIADRLQFSIEAEAPEEVDIELPAFGDKLEPFLIRDATPAESTLLDGGRLRRARTYTLEPVVSGEYVIEPLAVSFTVPGPDGEEPQVLESKAVHIDVASLLPEDVEALEVVDIVPPQTLPPPPLGPYLWGGAVAAVMLLAGWGVLRMRRRALPAREHRRPAHEVAYDALEALVADDLVKQGRVKEFYQRISAILRRYIEARFYLQAPEQTTEEFLSDLARNNTLQQDHKALLREFLTHCDLVKFAQLQPAAEDIQRTFDSCKAFIEETRVDREPEQQEGST